MRQRYGVIHRPLSQGTTDQGLATQNGLRVELIAEHGDIHVPHPHLKALAKELFSVTDSIVGICSAALVRAVIDREPHAGWRSSAPSLLKAVMHRTANVQPKTTLSRFSRVRQSFRQGAQNVGSALREDVRERLKKVRKVPRWLRILKTIYHEYGLKHVCLIAVLVIYQFVGAGVFYFCEAGFDESKEKIWNTRIAENRTKFVFDIIPLMFNNTDYLFFLTQEQTNEVSTKLHAELKRYEKQLGIKYTDQKIKWDFWNAMLYAQTICTTIGYGHLYPSTVAGRVFTMIYAIFGIPLVLSILDDLGKLLTRCLKTPWWLIKCGCRRMFRYCTKQTIAEIRKLDAEDKRDLDIFDLPIPIAIFVVIAWIFVCSATFCIWEHDWDYFVAFYFFFISLSTIGLGDITPTQPKYLLMLFIYIIIGLSLVSMCINLIQAKLERTYEAGRMQELELEAVMLVDSNRPQRRTSSLGKGSD
ncbi:unnamed protein product [Nippostrongylus brasiliensis]|uniref:Ion channel n=1 Tax=Nippostrongylus brasiliensis TaxID=27835 RepID=A0A0N4Y339_NIPBR|nr:unnamed protein product [Nippostrongylus brasiliensis]